jgi:hypothetical protein
LAAKPRAFPSAFDSDDEGRHNGIGSSRERITSLKGRRAMQSPSEAVFEAALKLPEGERLTLVSRLLETMPPEDATASLDDAPLAEELERRFADREGSVPWSDLQAEG